MKAKYVWKRLIWAVLTFHNPIRILQTALDCARLDGVAAGVASHCPECPHLKEIPAMRAAGKEEE